MHEAPECFKFTPGECHKPRASAERESATSAAAGSPASSQATVADGRARGDSAADEKEERREEETRKRKGGGKFSHLLLRPFTGVVSPAVGILSCILLVFIVVRVVACV